MADEPSKPHPEDLLTDLTDLFDILYDLPPTDRRSIRRERPGEEAMRQELVDNQPQYGEVAGISAGDVALVVQCTENVKRIDSKRQRVNKALELLDESRDYWIDKRERRYTTMREKADSSYKETKNEQIRAKFELLPAYCGQSADKAVKTRKQNALSPKAGAILNTLDVRGITVDDASYDRVAKMQDQATLDLWLSRAGAVAKLQDLFA